MFSFSVGKVVSIFLLKVDYRAEQCSGKVPGTGYEGEHEDQERNIVYSDIKDSAPPLALDTDQSLSEDILPKYMW